MKTFTSFLVIRLLAQAFTLVLICFAGKASAYSDNNGSDNPGIEYASLAATATATSVFINWVTVSELNNSHFEVERSTDMKSFKTVAMILDGFAATGTNGKTYKFKEAAGAVGKGKTVYYRLKQIDINNQVHYSTVMAVKMNATVTVLPQKETSVNKGYSNNQIRLSKQSKSGMGKIKIPVVEPTTGILAAHEIIAGLEQLNAPKLNLV